MTFFTIEEFNSKYNKTMPQALWQNGGQYANTGKRESRRNKQAFS